MLRYLPTLAMAAALMACNKKTAVQFSYPQNPTSYCAGAAITPNKPVVTGQAARFTVSPALPAGLVLNQTDGSISGTPTAAAAATDYTVSALGAGGEALATQPLTIGVGAAFSFPALLELRQDSTVSVTPMEGAGVQHCVISPALPMGLALDSATCRISGKPTEGFPATDFKLSAHGPCSRDSVAVRISVAQTKPVTELRASRLNRANRPERKRSRFMKEEPPARF